MDVWSRPRRRTTAEYVDGARWHGWSDDGWKYAHGRAEVGPPRGPTPVSRAIHKASAARVGGACRQDVRTYGTAGSCRRSKHKPPPLVLAPGSAARTCTVCMALMLSRGPSRQLLVRSSGSGARRSRYASPRCAAMPAVLDEDGRPVAAPPPGVSAPFWLPTPPPLRGQPARAWSPAALAYLGDSVWEVRRLAAAQQPCACLTPPLASCTRVATCSRPPDCTPRTWRRCRS